MTWYFSPSETTFDAYDHTGAEVATGRAFSGSWSGVAPAEVFTVMYEEADAAHDAGNTSRALRIVAEAAFKDIEQGTPPA